MNRVWHRIGYRHKARIYGAAVVMLLCLGLYAANRIRFFNGPTTKALLVNGQPVVITICRYQTLFGSDDQFQILDEASGTYRCIDQDTTGRRDAASRQS